MARDTGAKAATASECLKDRLGTALDAKTGHMAVEDRWKAIASLT